MTTLAPTVSDSIEISASADAVYGLVSNLTVLAEISAETTAARWTKGDRAAVGAVFRGSNVNGSKKWTTTCTVTDAAAGRSFGFAVTSFGIPISRWRYDIEPTATGCRVIESTWDQRPGWFHRIGSLATGVHDRAGANADHITETLARLKERAERA